MSSASRCDGFTISQFLRACDTARRRRKPLRRFPFGRPKSRGRPRSLAVRTSLWLPSRSAAAVAPAQLYRCAAAPCGSPGRPPDPARPRSRPPGSETAPFSAFRKFEAEGLDDDDSILEAMDEERMIEAGRWQAGYAGCH